MPGDTQPLDAAPSVRTVQEPTDCLVCVPGVALQSVPWKRGLHWAYSGSVPSSVLGPRLGPAGTQPQVGLLLLQELETVAELSEHHPEA